MHPTPSPQNVAPLFAALALALALLNLTPALAQGPELIESGVSIRTANETTTLDRKEQRLESRLLVTVTNTGTSTVLPPLHVVVGFDALQGVSLDGLQVANALGGIGQPPYQTFYYDCSSKSDGDGLAPGESFELDVRFGRPRTLVARYNLRLAGLINRPPDVVDGGPYRGTVGEAVSFDASQSSDPDNDELTFQWTLPGGSTLEGPTVQASFDEAGIQQVVLAVTDARGATTEKDVEVIVLPPGEFALGRVRVLDGLGHPLEGVTVAEEGPLGSVQFELQTAGFGSLGSTPGGYLWRFSKEGHLDVCRRATLLAGEVGVIPNPWMQKLSGVGSPLSLLNDSTIATDDQSLQITFPGGAFTQSTEATLTELHGQALPGALPSGWSPLRSFHLALPQDPLQPGTLTATLPGEIPAGSQLVLASFDEANCEWIAREVLTPENGSITANLTTRGSFTIILSDAAPTAPPEATMDAALPAFPTAPQLAGVTALGVLDPPEAVASRVSAEVISQAAVAFTGQAALPSGTWFQADVREHYELSDGQSLVVPEFDQTYYAYRSLGGDSRTVTADFPVRPTLLFGPEELNVARVQIDVLGRIGFAGGVVAPGGGVLASGPVTISLPAGAVSNPAAAGLRSLSPDEFASFAPGFGTISAFALDIGDLAPGSELGFAFSNPVAPNTAFLLAQLVSAGNRSGLQPITRLASDSNGNLSSIEPVSEPRLNGLRRPGTYLLLQAPNPLALIQGRTLDSNNSPLSGVAVSALSSPWLSLSNASGNYEVVASEGTGSLLARQLSTGDASTALFTVEAALAPLAIDLTIGPAGPSVVATSPPANAIGVARVIPLSITFSEAINPATFGPDAITLHLADDTLIPGSLSLASGNSSATFLPTNPLDYDTVYIIQVSAALTDPSGLPLEGTRLFSFRTETAPNRGAGAQLVIYEPGAANIPQEVLDDLVGYRPGVDTNSVVCSGSSGTADPEVPVILINDLTGSTTTVLSKPDGSFASFIDAGEDDFISATFVNANGTRVTVPATMQIYDDGSYGLYRYGGILEAQSDGGPVQIIIEPEAIETRTRFSIEIFDPTELLALLNGLVPEGDGKVLGGFNVTTQGDELRTPMDISYPITEAELELPPGAAPEEAGFGIARIHEVLGLRTFEILDKAEYVDGHLVTASPPFPGSPGGNTLLLRFLSGGKAVVSGRAVSTNGDRNPETGEHRPIREATIFIVPDFQTYLLNGGLANLSEGAFVATTDNEGAFSMIADFDVLQSTGFAMIGVSPFFPGTYGTGGASVDLQTAAPAASSVVYFDRTRAIQFALPDTRPPTIRPSQSPRYPGPGTPVTLVVTAIDDVNIDTIELEVESVAPLPGVDYDGVEPVPADVQAMANDSTPAGQATIKSRSYTVSASKALRCTFKLTSTDGEGNLGTLLHQMVLGSGTLPPTPPTADPNDTTPPSVVDSRPVEGDLAYDRFEPIVIRFSEAMDDSFNSFSLTNTTGSPFYLSPDAGEPFIQVSPDKRIFTLRYPEMEGGKEYTLSVSSINAFDLNGNALDQDTTNNFADDFTVDFTTRTETTSDLPITNGGGVVQLGDHLFALDRKDNSSDGEIKVFRVENDFSISERPDIDVPPYPRTITAIPNYSFATDFAGSNVVTADLIVVAGGLAGGNGQWYRVLDVNDPDSPNVVSTGFFSLAPDSVVVKMDWDAPTLAFLEFIGSVSTVNYVNLQLLILAQNPVNVANAPDEEQEGVDLNGDGDYVDPGEILPLPDNSTTLAGIVKGGLVGAFNLAESEHQILDFDMAFGGRFLSAVAVYKGDDLSGNSIYKTILSGGELVDTGVYSFFGGRPKRVLNLFGVALAQTDGSTKVANLALVSNNAKLTVLDITNVGSPEQIAQFEFTGEITQSAILTQSGLVAVSTNQNVYFYDPTAFNLGDGLLIGDPHPATAGLVAGMGAGSYSFVSTGPGLVVTNLGGRNRILADTTLTPDFSVSALDGEDEKNIDPAVAAAAGPFFAGTTPKRFPRNGLFEMVIRDNSLPGFGNGEKKKFTAALAPANSTPPPGFPQWTFADQTGSGKTVEFFVPHYDGNPGASLLWNEDLEPDSYQMTCQGQTIRVEVYPLEKKEVTFDFAPLVSRINQVSGQVQSLVNFALAGPGPIPVSGEIQFYAGTPPMSNAVGPSAAAIQLSYATQFKECDQAPNENRVLLTHELVGKIDPLFSASGKIIGGFNFPGLGVAGIFIELYGKTAIELAIKIDECGEVKSCATMKGAVGAKAGLDFQLFGSTSSPGLVGATLAADTNVEAAFEVCTDFTTEVTGELTAKWNGIVGSLTLQALGGTLQQQTAVSLVPGQDFIPSALIPQAKFQIYEFPP